MSDPTILTGYIEEALPTYQPDHEFFRRANNDVLASLPTDDSYPPLCRCLFATTGTDTLHGSFRGRRLIFFAAHLNYFLANPDEWLTKFDTLLRRLYWLRAELFTWGGWSGEPLRLAYDVTSETILQYSSDAPKPPESWQVIRANSQSIDTPGDSQDVSDQTMSVAEIQEAIAQLPALELRELTGWFMVYQAANQDQ